MSFVKDLIFGNDDAEQAAVQAAQVQVGAQREALDYVKTTEELPQQFRRGALKKLGGLAGLEGGEGDQQEMVDRAIQSPLYKAIMGGQELGEESIMRSAGATGGLRSGNVQGAMFDYTTQLQNQALLSSYNEQLMGIQGLAGLPSNTNQVAGMMQNIGTTQAQGITAGANASNMGNQQVMNNLLGIAGTVAMFSDRRLKKNIVKLGQINGYNFYIFEWNSIANKLGLKGSTMGCMAEEVFKEVPEAVFFKNNFLMVNYSMIGVL